MPELLKRQGIVTLFFLVLVNTFITAQSSQFNIIAFYTAKQDLAHISFVHEANNWFPAMGVKYHFGYD